MMYLCEATYMVELRWRGSPRSPYLSEKSAS